MIRAHWSGSYFFIENAANEKADKLLNNVVKEFANIKKGMTMAFSE